MEQLTLDSFTMEGRQEETPQEEGGQAETGQEEPGQKEGEPSEVYRRAEEATREKFYEWFGVKDNACCEHGKINFKLHAGALWLYRDASGNFKAFADDHVYHKCEHGLMENIKALKKIFGLLDERFGLKLFAVGKDYDDDLHIHVLNINEKTNIRLIEEEFEEMGLEACVTVLKNTNLDELVESFENDFKYMQAVGSDVLQRGLDEGEQEVKEEERKADAVVSDASLIIAKHRYGVKGGKACCPYGEPNLRLHTGALELYRAEAGVFKAKGDLDHVYHRCEVGLINNIRALKMIFEYFASHGLNVYAVSKSFDDNVSVLAIAEKAYSRTAIINRGPPEIRGLKILVETRVGSYAEAVKDFERYTYYMQVVDGDVLHRALTGYIQGGDGLGHEAPSIHG
jgi:hypothetical protein